MKKHTYDKVNKYNGHDEQEGQKECNHSTRERQLEN